ncbi:unnamed protein product [Musa acuminata subsp. malaccensis]|uniref:(wild Malaysian banana) hypothetical protein n=1 Tax=Musa acuminata subsp. malaccensis TaxID=214687 RepID=A0A804HMC3_MUSAM|nr:unnamed protein product [Musa acuminata subsp. malaccensis]
MEGDSGSKCNMPHLLMVSFAAQGHLNPLLRQRPPRHPLLHRRHPPPDLLLHRQRRPWRPHARRPWLHPLRVLLRQPGR